MGLTSGTTQGTGTLLTIKLKAKGTGTTTLNFDSNSPRNTEMFNCIAIVPLSTQIGTITMAVPIHFEPNLEHALVYPNPYAADSCGSEITFDRLSIDSTIQIFTIAGELVCEIRVESSPQKWDAKNSVGERVASGIYIYLIKDPSGNNKVGKLAVIR